MHAWGGKCADGVFGEPKPVPDHQPSMIVQESEQVSFAVPDPGAVQRIADPEFVGVGGFEPAEHLRALSCGRSYQLAAVEVAQRDPSWQSSGTGAER